MSCKFYILSQSVLKVIIRGTDWVSLFVLFAHNHSMADYIIDQFGLILFERCFLFLPLFFPYLLPYVLFVAPILSLLNTFVTFCIGELSEKIDWLRLFRWKLL